MADGAHDYAFVHMTLKIGAGRDMETNKQTGKMLFEIITKLFAPLQKKIIGAFFCHGRARPSA